MKIGIKIGLTFFLIAFLSMLVIGIISYSRAKQALEKESFNRLTAVREMKSGQIEDYFQLISDQVVSMAEDPLIVDAMKEFKKDYTIAGEELNVTEAKLASLKKENDRYFEKEYLARLNSNLEKKAETGNEVSHSRNTVVLQNLFIVNNPQPVGSKQLTDSLSTADFSYNKTHARFHPLIRDFLDKFGYYDIFLIDDETGNIVYTVFKEVDFATSLASGPFKQTNLAKAFEAVKNEKKNTVRLVDFEPYHPSYNAPASFIACPVYDREKKVGVLAFQMPIDRINDIMTNNHNWLNVGLGTTGETYIVGQDYKIRNQSRFLIEDSASYFNMLRENKTDPAIISRIRNFNSTIGLQQVKTEGTAEALKGISNTRIFPDYRGVPVLSAYKPLKIKDMQWVIMSEIDEAEAFDHVYALRNSIVIGFLCLIVLVTGAAYVVSREITKPLKTLTIDALELAKGNMDVEIPTGRKDEIGILAVSFKKMQSSISKLVNDLRHINHTLEEKVTARTAEVVKQKDIIEHKQKEIVDSMQYAKRIQYTILAHDEFLEENLPEHFIFFRPKDIVSGDFYWATSARVRKTGNSNPSDVRRKENPEMHQSAIDLQETTLFYLAVCDSTGHGVPGAFMSLLNISFLNEAINEKKITAPNEILNYVRTRLSASVSKDGAQDGMDGILICLESHPSANLDPPGLKISYAAAHNRPVLIHNKQLMEQPADKMPVGVGVRTEPFTLRTIEMKKGDSLFLYTDGYADQFGGPKGKKFKYKHLNEILLQNADKSMQEQHDILETTFNQWKGDLEQIDDVCIIGIRF